MAMWLPSRGFLRQREGAWLLLALLLAGCARQPLPLREDPRLAGADPWLAPDLEAASRELPGEPLRDLARLTLIDGREGEPAPLEGGWRLQVRRDWPRGAGGARAAGQALLVWLGTGRQAGTVRLLGRADSLAVLRQEGDGQEETLLLLAREGGRRRLECVDALGRRRVLAEDDADRLRWEDGALLVAEEREAPAFRERTGSWHLERRRTVAGGPGAWRLGPAIVVDSPYRALAEFLDASRRGRWRQARARADLSRLLALPGGGYSRELKASLAAGSPELLDRRVLLAAPPGGAPITHLVDLEGRRTWRVALERRSAAQGPPRWVLTRLERVLG